MVLVLLYPFAVKNILPEPCIPRRIPKGIINWESLGDNDNFNDTTYITYSSLKQDGQWRV